VTSGRPRRLLGPTVGSAVVLAVSALILWGVSLWVSWAGDCPGGSKLDEGLDRGITVWPPAAACSGGGGTTFWHQALPWAPWVIGFLVTGAAAILLTGLIVTIRDLRRPTPATTPGPIPVLERPLPDRGPSGGHPYPHGDVEADGRDHSAMAA
jgi:hypothetical protein